MSWLFLGFTAGSLLVSMLLVQDGEIQKAFFYGLFAITTAILFAGARIAESIKDKK